VGSLAAKLGDCRHGLLVVYRLEGNVLRGKVALMQSKRLYPNEQELEEDTPLGLTPVLESVIYA
jgi:hypothetical protein